LLLKRDGTLWRWGMSDFSEKQTWPGLRAFTPMQLGHDSDWTAILHGSWSSYGWKKDGTAWWFYAVPEWINTNTVLPGLAMQRFTPLDNARWSAQT
jgi:hypothetical protein